MRTHRIAHALALLVAIFLMGAAQTTSPATTQAIDTPLRALTLHAIAMAAGDPQGVRKCYATTNPADETVANAYMGMAGSIFRLQQAANEKFGPHGFELIGFGRMFNEEIPKLRHAQVKMQDGKAYVYAAGPKKAPLVLLKVNDDWKISVGDSFSNPHRRAARILAQSRAYDELANEIAHERYSSVNDAKEAGRAKVEKAMKAVEADLPGSRPTTASDQQERKQS